MSSKHVERDLISNDMSWWLADNRLHSLGIDPLARISQSILGHISLISRAIPPPGCIQSRVDSDKSRAAVRQTSRVATPDFDSTKQCHRKAPVQACRLISQNGTQSVWLGMVRGLLPILLEASFHIQLLIPRSPNLVLERCCLNQLD